MPPGKSATPQKNTPAVGIEPTTSGSGNRRASIAPRGLACINQAAETRAHPGRKTSPSWVRTSDLQVNSLTRYRLRHGGIADGGVPAHPPTTRSPTPHTSSQPRQPWSNGQDSGLPSQRPGFDSRRLQFCVQVRCGAAAAVWRLSSVAEHWSCKPRVGSSILPVACSFDGKTNLREPGIEPGPTPWQGAILPLDHSRCTAGGAVTSHIAPPPHTDSSRFSSVGRASD